MYLVAHGTISTVLTAVCAVALLLVLGGMEGLEALVIGRWQKWRPKAGESDFAGWLAARQLFVALIVTAGEQVEPISRTRATTRNPELGYYAE